MSPFKTSTIMRTIRVKISSTDDKFTPWYASHLVTREGLSDQQALDALNHKARALKKPFKYELATEDEYWEYRKGIAR